MISYQMLIGGKYRESGAENMPVLNPADEKVLGTVPAASAEDAERALKAAASAQHDWSRLTGGLNAEMFCGAGQTLSISTSLG